jgi:hypothetical protein
MTNGVHEVSPRRERITSPERIARVLRNRAKAEAKRTADYAETRTNILAELGPNPSSTMVDLAEEYAFAKAESVDLFAKFLRCSATEAEMSRLGLVRSQMARLLSLLGLPKATNNGAASVTSIDGLRREYSRKDEES